MVEADRYENGEKRVGGDGDPELKDSAGALVVSAAGSESARAVVGAELQAALVEPAKPDDLVLWAAMSPGQRQKALERIELLSRWHGVRGERGDLTAETAARKLGVKPKRFYEMASAWKRTGSIAVLGAFAAPTERKGRLDARAVNALQAHLPGVIAEHPNAPVERVRAALEERARAALEAGGLEFTMPSKNIVRTMIQREVARLDQAKRLGHALRLDCSATSLVRPDGVPHVVFAIMERTAGLVLGFSLGSPRDSVAGYAAAAADALGRTAPFLPDTGWTDATSRLDMVPGEDVARWKPILIGWRAGRALPELEAGGSGRYGRYFREVFGERVGRTYFRPSRTLSSDAGGDAGGAAFSDEEALLRLGLDFAAHNAAASVHVPVGGGGRPENLLAALGRLAALPA